MRSSFERLAESWHLVLLYVHFSLDKPALVRARDDMLSAAFPPVMSCFRESARGVRFQWDAHTLLLTQSVAMSYSPLNWVMLSAEESSCSCVSVHPPCTSVSHCSTTKKAAVMRLPCWEIHLLWCSYRDPAWASRMRMKVQRIMWWSLWKITFLNCAVPL